MCLRKNIFSSTIVFFLCILSVSKGGLFFAKPMRSKRYVTMLDPFQHRYGNMFTAILLLPAMFSDVLWVACILAALGRSLCVCASYNVKS